MTFFRAEDLLRWRWLSKFDSVELVGDVGTFGHILVDGRFKIGILITDEEAIMNELERFMNFPQHSAAIPEF
jgi:hypothetical protein